MSTAWMQYAACADKPPALFFAADGEPPEARVSREAEAGAVCNGCPVKAPCLAYRLSQPRQHDDMIWAGLDGDDRARLLRNRRRAGRSAA